MQKLQTTVNVKCVCVCVCGSHLIYSIYHVIIVVVVRVMFSFAVFLHI